MKHHRPILRSLLALVLSVCMLLGNVQGIGAAVAAGADRPLINVALHKPAYTDTIRFNKVPAFAVDGDRSTGSHCDMGDTLPASLTVDLLAEYDLEQINVTTYYDGARYYSYDVYVSLDNVNFERVCGKNDETPASAAGETYDLPVTKARYVRVTVTKLTDPSNPANIGAHLVELAAMARAEKEASPLVSGDAAVTSEKGVPARVNDGNFGSYWDGAETPSSFIMDLGGWYNVDQIDLWPYFASKGRVYHYTVYASKDSMQYDEIARKEDARPVSTTGDVYLFDTPVLARYIKVEMTYNSANPSVHMNEMRVYGTHSEYEDPILINIARGKPAYSMAGTPSVITDGDYGNYWDGSAAPSEFEIDLEKWYDLRKLVLFPYFDDKRYYHYEIYTSCNGLDYTLLTQKENDDWSTASGDTYLLEETVLARFIKVRMTYNSANPSVHMKELEAYGLVSDHEEPVFQLPGEDPEDPDNIAFGKPVRVPMNRYYAPRITDGSNSTYWGAQYYPSYADIDLKENYALSDITVTAPVAEGRYYGYSVYGSTDGVHFDLLARKEDRTPATEKGDTIALDGAVARILRISTEYTSDSPLSFISEVRAHGTPTGEAVTERPEISIPDFEDTEYALPVTEQETLDEVAGVVTRTIGAQYLDWFSFVIEPNTENGNDYFAISDTADGRIRIAGNEGLSLTTGLNHYLKYFCKVAIQQETMQVNMPAEVVPVGEPIRKESPYPVRYAYNYCTLSYTMSFWGADEWQREMDWLALNGVNVMLDLTGQEEVWRRFLTSIGYTTDEAKDWVTGPTYYAWQFMDNMENFGGPVPDQWIIDRVELARANHRRMAALGMQPVMQGYAGMVPTAHRDRVDPEEVQILEQGKWCGMDRPSMIRTDAAIYDTYAELFYKAQREVYGEVSDYYAVDPFHEGGIRPDDLSDTVIAQEVLESLLKEDPDAVWMIQAWWSNPTDELLDGLGEYREDHAIILDLSSTDQRTMWKSRDEFKGSSWIYCVLDNYGGNPSLHGELTALSEGIPAALAEAKHMKGIGVTAEALEHDPVYYELLFEMGWETGPVDLTQWLHDYAERRYGAKSEAAEQAWKLLSETAYYNAGDSHTGDANTIVTSTPGSGYSNNGTGFGTRYSPMKFERALTNLLEDFDRLADSESYLYDVVDLTRQQISNYQPTLYGNMVRAYKDGDLEAYRAARDAFMESIDIMEQVLQTVPTRTLDRWVGLAKERAAGYDDFSKRIFEIDAKAILTTWASEECSWSLNDYTRRHYAGLLGDFYALRWKAWTDKLETSLIEGTPYADIGRDEYFDIAWKDFVLADQGYALENAGVENPREELERLTDFVMEHYRFQTGPENIALDKPAEASGTEFNDGRWGPEMALDGVTSMTSRWSSNKSDDAWMTVDLTKPEAIYKVVLKWELKADNFIIQVSSDNKNWHTVNEEFRSKPNEGGYAVVNELEFAPVTARYVRLQVIKRALALDGTYKGCGLYEFEVYRAAETPLVVTGAPESGSTRGAVTLTAEKEATWTVNGTEVERASTTIQFRDEGAYTVTARTDGEVSEIIAFSIDRTAPVLTASVEHYGITNQDVFFNASEEVTFYNGSEIISEGIELTLTESGTYNIRAIDKAGNYTAFYRVTIMKEAPVLTGAPEGVTRSNIAIRSNVKVLFIVNSVEADDYAYGLKITEEGKYTVKAVDMAGNESEVSFEIDRTKPTFTASVPSGQATGKDITLTANEVVDFVIDGVTVATGTEYTISRSGLTVVSIYDLAGNYGGVYKANIDKSAPVLSAVIEGTNKAVENGATVKQNVTVKTSKASYFIVNDGEPTARANFVKLKASGTYTVKAVDMLGNVSEVFTVTIAR